MATLEAKQVLLVEDEAATRTMLARQLRRCGMAVTAVESGEQVLVEAGRRDHPFDLVISDVHLPGMSGIDLAALILSASPHQPIVLITGDPDEALAREALARGPVGYLLKPFELADLTDAVQHALERAELSAAAELPPADSTGRVPLGWLDILDQRSYAGPGHARRVARIAMALAEAAKPLEQQLQVGELVVAAWSHELGRLSADTADGMKVAAVGAQLLSELGCAAGVVEGVRHLHERFDGRGGPDGLAGDAIPAIAQILAVADSLDHYAAAWLQAGKGAAEAVERALGLVRLQRQSVFADQVVAAAAQQHDRIVTICGEGRQSTSEQTTAAVA